MPRLPPQLLRRASRISPNLRELLPACRDLQSAANELRWIKEHVNATTEPRQRPSRLKELCIRRGRLHEPLQYILGSQPFGSLEIICKPHVLIPRSDTEAYVCHLVDLVKSGSLLRTRSVRSREINVLDLCTGTGCIPLLLYAELSKLFKNLHVRGLDVSDKALRLARENILHNVGRGYLPEPTHCQKLSFIKGNVFDDTDIQSLGVDSCDIMVSNPPYIAENTWHYGRGDLGYSVRKHEPRLALVPGSELPRSPPGLHQEDIFYARLLDIATKVRTSILVLEIGDSAQARRVVEYAARHSFGVGSVMEIWRDWPDNTSLANEAATMLIVGKNDSQEVVSIKGSGNMRSVVITKT